MFIKMKYKKLKLLLTGLCFFLLMNVYGQISSTDLIQDNNLIYLFVNNGTSYYLKSEKIKHKDKYIVFKDTVPLDTIDFIGYKLHVSLREEEIYIRRKEGFQKFSLDSGEMTSGITTNREVFTFDNQENLIVGDPKTNDSYYFSQNLFKFNLKTKNLTSIISLSNKLRDEKYKIGSVISSPETRKYLIEAGLYDGGGFVEYQHFIYSANEGATVDYSMKDKLGVDGIDGYGDYLLLRNGSYILIGKFLLDKDFNLYSKVLLSSHVIVGYEIEQEELKAYFLESITDEGIRVVIKANINPDLEIILHRIYNDVLLEKKDIRMFSSDELWILKNMLFAKHNYGFKNKYLQAWFNLYTFYWPNKSSRKNNVTLTEIDKKNLELIQSRMKKAE